MIRRRAFIATGAAFTVAGCASSPRFLSYDGPEVTRVVINKGDRQMFLLSGQELLDSYRVDLGFAPVGDKRIEGDGKTPEGSYIIDRRNPESQFHLSLGISYPDEDDIAEAAALGKPPGGDIFIHGRGRGIGRRDRDWTAGCISVSNREIEEVYSMVRDGTAVDIYP